MDNLNSKETTNLFLKKILSQTINPTPVEKMTAVFEDFSKIWREDNPNFDKYVDQLVPYQSFSKEELKDQLLILGEITKAENLLQRLNSEFPHPNVLDGFHNLRDGKKLYYAPLGKIVHITAGNIFLGAFDSFIMGILTKNFNILKLSLAQKNILMELFKFLEKVDFQNILRPYYELVYWKGGQTEVEELIFKSVDGIIAWGGSEMETSINNLAPSQVKVIIHGAKVGLQVVSKKAFENHLIDFDELLKDIVIYEQSACASSQNLFIEEGIDQEAFKLKLEQAIMKLQGRGNLSGDEYVEIIKDTQEALYYEFKNGDVSITGDKIQIIYNEEELSSYTSNRCLKLKKYQNLPSLASKLKNYKSYLQTCGLGVAPDESISYKIELSKIGIKRFTNLGQMLIGKIGYPHDGSFNMLDLTVVCADESIETMDEFLNELEVPFFAHKKDFKTLPLMSGEDIANRPIWENENIYHKSKEGGYIYSSGGTSGKPKFCYYSYDEFTKVSSLLAESYIGLGLKPKDNVANLFMAGNLWSSFNAIQEALSFCKLTQFPLGGSIEPKYFKEMVERFKINIVFGLPGILTELATKTKGIKIDKIFFAGEAFSFQAQNIVKSCWGEDIKFYSAGYASVDVGIIGYQTLDCKPGEHYLFQDLVNLEVIEGEAVVSSKIRKSMPVLRYKTGDRVKILDEKRGKFKLLGRMDQKINIWSCRINLDEIEKGLQALNYDDDYQILIKDDESVGETLNLKLKSNNISLQSLKTNLYRELKDFANTWPCEYLDGKLKLEIVSSFQHVERTGKMAKLLDLRRY